MTYRKEASRPVYGALAERAAVLLRAGHAAVVDAVFLDPAERTQIERVAHAAGMPFQALWLSAPEDILMERVAARRGDVLGCHARRAAPAAPRPDPGEMTWQRLDVSGSPRAIAAQARRGCCARREAHERSRSSYRDQRSARPFTGAAEPRRPGRSAAPRRVFVQSGDRVPADLRLVRIKGLQSQEGALTGKSLPVGELISIRSLPTRRSATAPPWPTRGRSSPTARDRGRGRDRHGDRDRPNQRAHCAGRAADHAAASPDGALCPKAHRRDP